MRRLVERRLHRSSPESMALPLASVLCVTNVMSSTGSASRPGFEDVVAAVDMSRVLSSSERASGSCCGDAIAVGISGSVGECGGVVSMLWLINTFCGLKEESEELRDLDFEGFEEGTSGEGTLLKHRTGAGAM